MDAVHDEIFAEVNYHAAVEPMRAVRTTRHKYIRCFDLHRGPILPNCDDSVSKSVLLARGWRHRDRCAEYLFDLIFDPNEAANVVGDPGYTDILHEMRDRLTQWMRESNDPLLSGGLDPWPGMVVNRVEDASAQGPTVPAQPCALQPPTREAAE